MRRWLTWSQGRSLKRRSTASVLLGIALIALAAVFTVQHWLPDAVSTVLGAVGVAGLIYGVATAVMVLLDSEPNENEPGPWVGWGRRDDDRDKQG